MRYKGLSTLSQTWGDAMRQGRSMAEPNRELEPQELAETRRPWRTPQIIASKFASEAAATGTSTPFPDGHGGATSSFGLHS